MQKKIINAKINSLSQANKLVRDRKYEEALALYEWVLSLYPSLHKVIIPNIDYVKRKISKAGSQVTHKVKLERPITLEKYLFDIIEESGLFDPVWYLSEYGKKYKIEDNPLAHYLDFGVKNGLNPSTQFDTNYYLKSNPDIASAGINPFIHYTSQGRKENRSPLPPSQPDFEFNYSIETPKYVQRLAPDSPPVEKSVRVIAFYLPQFHPISENDAWWGKGFTEWTNVRPAKPQFEGHYQPHVPDDYLGYYDLRDTSIMHKQIELAKQYGIEGFCFYTYWFTGHRLLETPVDNYLSDASLDHPFCICWANENWSRRWDGLDQDLLMVQRYSDEDDIAFISHMSKYLRDPRYIRVEGKPLLIIYRPNLFPSMKETAGRWRDWCLNNGLGEIHLAYVQSFEKCDPADYGFDVAIEFPPNNSSPPDITQNAVSLSTEFSGKVYDWRVFLQRSENFDPPNYPLFRGACPSWDNTARKKERGTIFANSSPKLFERWLVSAFEDTLHRTEEFDQSLVFINAWNEWAEGAHLEPDKRYGYGWLQSLRNAHESINAMSKLTIAVVIHVHYPEILHEIMNNVSWMNADVTTFYITTNDGKEVEIKNILNHYPFRFSIANFNNKGRDVLPFLKVLPDVLAAGADLILKVHTKKSLHRIDGDAWRSELYDVLLSKSFMTNCKLSIISNPNFGLSAPAQHIVPMSYYWGSNRSNMESLTKRIGCLDPDFNSAEFVAGTMFMASKTLMFELLKLNLKDSDFEDELGQTDGTMAHAVERMIGFLSYLKGLEIYKFGKSTSEDYKYAVSS